MLFTGTTSYLFHCDPILYITALGGHNNVTFSLNVHAVNLKSSGKGAAFIL
jgi:hypothetical protein